MSEEEKNTEVAIIPELNDVVTHSKVEASKATQHARAFAPNMEKIHELSKYLGTVNKENPTDQDSKIARINRLALVKNRTSAEAIKDERKSTLVVESRLIDGLYAVIKNTSVLTEQEYLKIEQFAELREKERKEKLKLERLELIKEHTDQGELYQLGEMSPDGFEQLLNGLKTAHEAKIEAENKAEEARKEKERIDALHKQRKDSMLNHWQFFPEERKNDNFGEYSDQQWEEAVSETAAAKKTYDDQQEKIRLENERLKKEKEEAERLFAEQMEIRGKAAIEFLMANDFKPIEGGMSSDTYQHFIGEKHYSELETDNELEAFKQGVLNLKERALERKKAEDAKKKADAAKATADAKLKKEREAREKAEADLKAKEEAEKKAVADKAAAEKKAARQPDKNKLEKLSSDLDAFPFPEMKTEDGKKILLEIKIQVGKIVNFIDSKTQDL